MSETYTIASPTPASQRCLWAAHVEEGSSTKHHLIKVALAITVTHLHGILLLLFHSTPNCNDTSACNILREVSTRLVPLFSSDEKGSFL